MTKPELNDVSVLIVTWHGDDLLRNCLDSISQVYGDSLEIVIVDNANLESTRELVSHCKNAKYIPSKTNLGFAGGNNLRLPACTRKYVLLLNDVRDIYIWCSLYHRDGDGGAMVVFDSPILECIFALYG